MVLLKSVYSRNSATQFFSLKENMFFFRKETPLELRKSYKKHSRDEYIRYMQSMPPFYMLFFSEVLLANFICLQQTP